MTFRIGQKVVCIKRGRWKIVGGVRPRGAKLPLYRDVYTIAEVDGSLGRQWLRLDELDGNGLFDAVNFRPLVKRKTDISIFTKILDDVRAGKVREIA
jgi:hypothetical protein